MEMTLKVSLNSDLFLLVAEELLWDPRAPRPSVLRE